MATSSNYTNEYMAKLEAGLEFQDYVCMKLHAAGIVLQNVQSRKGQLKKENLYGLEIKYDRKFHETGNLYIETAEKTRAENPNFVASGIFREDENWQYGIGDERTFFIFGRKMLRHAARSKRFREVGNPTSKGFLMPVPDARKYADRVFDWGKA